MSAKTFFDDSPTLFVQTGDDKSQLFGFNFLRNVKDRFILRLTGGCGLMEPSDAIGLQNLTNALTGWTASGPPRNPFAGFCLFGGSRMVYKDDPAKIVPGITEVAPALSKYCPHCVTLGVIVKSGHMRYTPHGILISSEPNKPYATIIHPEQTSCAILQPSVDSKAPWEDEWKECLRICSEVKETPGDWRGLLVVYNGGMYAKQETLAWAKMSKIDPFWRVLLVKGSGRIADELANDADFLAEHSGVHVCRNNVDHMREKLLELGALTLS
ncbi:MAG: hypothetical protein K2W82_16980 [Candidatus Obscuribacterales bacterium]|nr:hypothetical protein [Candidatus Obscuribacterales bacterium]